MAVISGIGAVVHHAGSAESTVRQWQIRLRGLPHPFTATNTDGAMNRNIGNVDWRGFVLGYGHTPNVFPGDSFLFEGTTDGTQGVTGTARCQRITITTPVERGAQIQYRVDFAANGVLTLLADVGGTPLVDATAVNAYTAVGKKINLGGTTRTDDGTAVPQLRLWQLSMSRRLRPYVHTQTDGQVQRTTGNLDVQWLYQVYVDSPADVTQIPGLQSVNMMKFYVTPTRFWQLRWGKLETVAPFGANREGQEDVGATLRGGLVSYANGELGSIYTPADSAKWGT